mgnify:CR=1 FL=1
MSWEPVDGINLLGVLGIFTLCGFFIGYLMGYIWVRLEKRKFMKPSELLMRLPGTENVWLNNDIYTANVPEPSGISPIKFYSMPVGYHPWKPPREYAHRV